MDNQITKAESYAYDKIRSAPSYPKLVRAYRAHLLSMYRPDDGYFLSRMAKVNEMPDDLLTAHASVMNAKSARAKTLKRLADSVFTETGLPRHAPGMFRGQDGIDWQKLESILG